MNKETYKILKEITSLDKKSKEYTLQIADELNRIKKIENMRNKRKDLKSLAIEDLKNLRKELTSLENSITLEQNTILKSKEHINSVFTEIEINALKSQIKMAEEKLEPLEEMAFSNLEKIETLEEEIQSADAFLEGSLLSIEEIEAEIRETNQGPFDQIKSIKSRIELLIPQIPEKAFNLFQKIREKDLKHGPLSKIETKSCFVCRFAVTAIDIQEVENHLKLRSCKGCSRIFIPETALY